MSNDYQQWLEEYNSRRDAERESRADEFRTTALPSLRALGVAEVTAEYSGYGDSGDIETVTAFSDSGREVPLDDKLKNGCVEFFYGFLPDGYEINDGGQGVLTLTVDADGGTIEVEHQENVTTTNDSRMEFTI